MVGAASPFRQEIKTRLDARHVATDTSYRRALGSCLRSLAARSPERRTVLVPAFCSSDYPDAIEALGYSLGTNYRDRPLGTFGDCALLNFQEGKSVPVEEGMVVSRTDAVDLSDDGRPPVPPNVGTLAGYGTVARLPVRGIRRRHGTPPI